MIGALLLAAIASSTVPPLLKAELKLSKATFVVGEPIGIEFIVENTADDAIQSRFSNDESFHRSPSPLRLQFRGSTGVAGTWESTTICAITTPAWRIRNLETGRWLIELEAQTSLKARFQVVPWVVLREPDKPEGRLHVLAPGRYEIFGIIPWVEDDAPLKTATVTIEIVESSRFDERRAVELMDYYYVSFFCEFMIGGYEDFEARESVAKILDFWPDSIHAIRIRNRLTQLRIRFLESMNQMRIRQDAHLLAQARRIAADIQAGVAARTNDILELDILSEAATKLFLKLEWVDEMEMTSKILDERYPDTEQAKTVREDLAKLKARQRP